MSNSRRGAAVPSRIRATRGSVVLFVRHTTARLTVNENPTRTSRDMLHAPQNGPSRSTMDFRHNERTRRRTSDELVGPTKPDRAVPK